MKFWRDPAHVRGLIGWILLSGAVCTLCFYTDLYMGALAAVLCVLFGVLRLISDRAKTRRLYRIRCELEDWLQRGAEPTVPANSHGEWYELQNRIYKTALRAERAATAAAQESRTGEIAYHAAAAQLRAKAGKMKPSAARGALECAARDLELLALASTPVKDPEGMEKMPRRADSAWEDALALVGEELTEKQMTATVETRGREFVQVPRERLNRILSAMTDVCARLLPEGSVLCCGAAENPVFVELFVTCPALDFSGKTPAEWCDPEKGGELALLALSRLAAQENGTLRIEPSRLVLRLFSNGTAGRG